MNVFVVGIGLIGGSMAKDIKRIDANAKIYGVDINDAHLEEAISLGVIDQKATYKDLELADMVIVSIPVDVMVVELPKILDAVTDNAIVLDAGSTKGLI